MYSCISLPLAGAKSSGLPVPIMLNRAASRKCHGQIFFVVVKSEVCINEMLGNMLRCREFIELKRSRVLCSLVSIARMF